jgi:Transglycosylase SLT domain
MSPMRSRSPFALVGVLVILLLSVVGFAAFSAEPTASSTTPEGVVFPGDASGRIAAAAIASQITSDATQQRLVVDARRAERAADRAAERAAERAAAPTTTSTAPATTAALATTAAPAATAAPTTTTAAPTTTTTTTAPPPPPTTTTTTEAPPVHSGGVEVWRPLVEEYWPTGQVDDALSVMDCESGGDPNAYNSASGASGLFQFLPGTWASASVSAGWSGADVFDGEANIAVAAWLSDASTSPWSQWNCKP